MLNRTTPSLMIAGGGPVGLTAAIELTRRGFSIRIIDPDPAPSPESRALAINARTLDLLEPCGATERLISAGNPIRELVLCHEGKKVATLHTSALHHRFNFLLCLPQSETERILAETLADLGQSIERNLALTSFSVVGDRVECNLSDGSACVYDYLIGADGARSSVRKALGFSFDGESEAQHFGLADVELDDWPYPWDTGVVTMREDHVVGFIPMREGVGRMISSRPDTLEVLPPEAKVRRIIWQTKFRINYRQVDSYQSGPVFLAGDAAHIHSPMGGRGMNLGIEDACWLAWLLQEGKQADYTALRHPVAAKVLRSTERPTNLITSKSWLSKLMRQTVVPNLLNRSLVQRTLLPGMMGLRSPDPPWLK